jgi:hypothetical protein
MPAVNPNDRRRNEQRRHGRCWVAFGATTGATLSACAEALAAAGAGEVRALVFARDL